MNILVIVFLVTLLLSAVLPATTDKEWRRKIILTFLPLFVFGALRVNFGQDYLAYEAIFLEHHDVESFSYDQYAHSEIGFQLLCYLVPSFRFLLVLNSFLLCLSLGCFIYRNVPRNYLWLAVILIFLNPEKNIYGSLVGMRNGFAVALFLLSVVFIQRRQIMAFVIMTLLAMSMHTSAVVYMPIAYLVGRNTYLTKKEIVVWIVVMIIFAVMAQTTLLNLAAPFVHEYLDRYDSYMNNDGGGHVAVLLFSSSFLFGIMILVLLGRHNRELTGNQRALYRLGLLYVFSNFWGPLTGRATFFYIMLFIATIIDLFKLRQRDSQLELGLLLFAIIVSLYSFNVWYHIIFGNPNYMIYHSVFE